MVLYNFFKPCKKVACDMPLPSPSGSLKKQLDNAVIEEANKEVSKLIMSAGRKRSPYLKVTPHQKAIIAKYAAEHGIVNSIWHFKKHFPEEALKKHNLWLEKNQGRRNRGAGGL